MIKKLDQEKLNLIIALCAMMVSIASFYATYLQAEAANKQVKIMTMPVIQFSQSNYDLEDDKPSIYFELHNVGSSPALLKDFSINYERTTYHTAREFLNACCQQEYQEFMNKLTNVEDASSLDKGNILTSTLSNSLIPANSKRRIFALFYGERSYNLWKKLDEERGKISVAFCFCSPLGGCYHSNNEGASMEIEACPASLN
ncbi:hypothetical protein [Microbulbifer variabilis]|uniref:hypothetical protein n=1 Tax=Microbulbifer variabilis TaxID=266805 RepID=UPI001CFC8C47|nr:hypothetical protein [Microbulbifer variabilis]